MAASVAIAIPSEEPEREASVVEQGGTVTASGATTGVVAEDSGEGTPRDHPRHLPEDSSRLMDVDGGGAGGIEGASVGEEAEEEAGQGEVLGAPSSASPATGAAGSKEEPADDRCLDGVVIVHDVACCAGICWVCACPWACGCEWHQQPWSRSRLVVAAAWWQQHVCAWACISIQQSARALLPDAFATGECTVEPACARCWNAQTTCELFDIAAWQRVLSRFALGSVQTILMRGKINKQSSVENISFLLSRMLDCGPCIHLLPVGFGVSLPSGQHNSHSLTRLVVVLGCGFAVLGQLDVYMLIGACGCDFHEHGAGGACTLGCRSGLLLLCRLDSSN